MCVCVCLPNTVAETNVTCRYSLFSALSCLTLTMPMPMPFSAFFAPDLTLTHYLWQIVHTRHKIWSCSQPTVNTIWQHLKEDTRNIHRSMEYRYDTLTDKDNNVTTSHTYRSIKYEPLQRYPISLDQSKCNDYLLNARHTRRFHQCD